ncbi:choice-of-anchor M domain-containing protein [Nocardioides sp. CPCC 205120]|uniref:choice-of-anchor M domain-containing protein n=1 Tax=Nocardioides sp. CPCC 205120 TaxID=3406462 RepID=UPI003B513AC5
MNPTSTPPRAVGLVVALATGLGALALPAAPAGAAEGPAPAPREHRVLQDVHTDAVSTFLDAGAFALGSKADVPEGNGTRLDPDTTWFHVDDDSVMTVPAGYEFVAPAGTQVWIAPESNPGPSQLWPGFSTESIPVGGVEGNRTTFTLTSLEGPGDLELFTSGNFGQPNRLWSSDEDTFRTFTIGRTHMHANWAFTAPGTYEVGVEATVTVGGQPQRDTATYTFVVGDLPEAVATTTTLSASSERLVLGDTLELAATVAPAEAAGYVELLAGERVLGHEAVVDGAARFTTDALTVGTHAITARFVPSVANLAAASTSAATSVVVTEEPDGAEFGIHGLRDGYTAGDPLTARVVGATLAEGQSYRWLARVAGSDASSMVVSGTGTEAAAGRLELVADMGWDGYELAVELVEGRTVVQSTPWQRVTVAPTSAPVEARLEQTGATYVGEPHRVAVTAREGAGETLRLVHRSNGYTWSEVPGAVVTDGALEAVPTFDTVGEWAVQAVRDGVAVAQSAPIAVDIRNREVLIEGVQGVYRDGSTLRATGTVFPAAEGLTYVWQYSNFDADPWVNTEIERGTGPEALSVEMPVTADLDGGLLYLIAVRPGAGADGEDVYAGQASVAINVSTADADEQVFFFQGLGGHYHQGGAINLDLVADPGLAEGDTVAWQWRWPGTEEWTTLPGAEGLSHDLVAEQALEGVQVRATLTFAGTDETVTTEPVAIHVDDHGAAPRQVVTVAGGAEQVTAGETVELTASVAPATVLDTYRWTLTPAGGGEPVTVEGATGATYAFPATTELDGAQVTASVVRPDGAVAYGPSAPVTLDVAPAAEPDVPALPQPGSVGTGSSISPAGPWQYGRLGTAKPISVFFEGHDGEAVTGTVFVTTRRAGTGQVTATAYAYDGTRRQVATPVLPQVKGSYQVGVVFVPHDDTYRTTQRHFWIWATPTGRP